MSATGAHLPSIQLFRGGNMIKSNKKQNSQDGSKNAITNKDVNKQANSLALLSQPNTQNR